MDNNKIITEDFSTEPSRTVIAKVQDGKVQTIYADPDIYDAVIKDMEANGMFDNNA